MWLWFVITGIIIILLVGNSIYWEEGIGPIILNIIGGVVIGAIVCGILAFLIGGIISNNSDIMIDTIESDNKIIALTDNSQTYLYRSADKNNNIRYNYMIKTERGYLTQSILANRAYIIETNDRAPSVETHQITYKSTFLRKHFFNDNAPYYYIYVPKGTIIGGFTIDLQ
mgnify:FL=1